MWKTLFFRREKKMWKNPIFQERKKNVKKHYFSGEKKKCEKTLFFRREKKSQKTLLKKNFLQPNSLQKIQKIFSSKKWLKIFGPEKKNFWSLFSVEKKSVHFENFLSWNIKYFDFVTEKNFLSWNIKYFFFRAERDTTEKKISKNPIFQERQKKRDSTEKICTFWKFFFFTSWNIKYFACVTLRKKFGHFFGEIHDFL